MVIISEPFLIQRTMDSLRKLEASDHAFLYKLIGRMEKIE
jgi:hypothetical protein